MMLEALYRLAQREHLVDDPDYERRHVDFLLRIDRDGGFLGLIRAEENKMRPFEIAVPRFPKRQGKGLAPGFLFDNAKYVLGLGGEGAEGGRNERCVAAFQSLVIDLAEKTSDEGARAVARFFDRRPEQLPAITREHPDNAWTGSEWLAFVLDGDGERRVHDRPAVRAYWAAQRSQGSGASGTLLARCLITGQLSAPVRTHDRIKRVPKAQNAGATLVTFNADAFTSHGQKQGENAPVCRAAAEGYVTALNWLLDRTAERRFRYGIPIGDASVAVFWTHEANAFVDDLPSLLDPRPGTERPSLAPGHLDDTGFYALTLSGNAARVVVRDFLATTVAEVKKNVRSFFDALRITPLYEQSLSIWRLLKSVEAQGGRCLSPDLGARLVRVALHGGAFPRELLTAALLRLRLPPDELDERRLLHARCALIKATLMRPPPRRGAPMEVPMSLDETNTQIPYLLGRLFAVLERLQAEAEGDVHATLRDRYFGVASRAPALIFPTLLQRSVHHTAKLGRPRGDHWTEWIKAKIMGALPAFALPRALSLEEQGLFAIGYYHQRQRFFGKRRDAEDDHERDQESV